MSENVLITGGSSGIGLATAIRFANEGFNVVACGRNADRLENAQRQMTEAAQAAVTRKKLDATPRIMTFACDLQDIRQCSQVPDQVSREMGTIDILINNAAAAPLCSFAETTFEDFEKVLAVNLRATWTLTQQIWKPMAARGFGAIVNISSMAAIDPFTGFSLYGASKGWLETWTKALADEGIRKGIRVYGIRPGAVETPLLRGLFPDYPPEECVSPELVADTIFNLVVHQSQPPGSIVTVASS